MDGQEDINYQRTDADILFTGKTMHCLLYALRSFYKKSKRNILMAAIIGIACMMIILMEIRFSEYQKVRYQNNQYQYMIDMPEYFDSCIALSNYEQNYADYTDRYNKIVEVLDKYKIDKYYYESSAAGYFIKKNMASEQLLEKLKSSNYDTYSRLRKNKASVGIEIMGYSDEMIKELGEKNGIADLTLNSNECVVFNHFIDSYGNDFGKLGSIPDSIKFESNIWDDVVHEHKRVTLDVKKSVEKLVVY